VEVPSFLPGLANTTDEALFEAYQEGMNELLERVEALGRRCVAQPASRGIWNYMDTASVARDLVRMADAIDGPGTPMFVVPSLSANATTDVHRNLWGLSYGGFIAQYFIDLFPDRVGKVFTDGSSDVAHWAMYPNYKISVGWFGESEKALDLFIRWCAEVRGHCFLRFGLC
jgi:pimeloyl-ACP methyl ester carboxylesterase